jgi:hypothetical protein
MIFRAEYLFFMQGLKNCPLNQPKSRSNRPPRRRIESHPPGSGARVEQSYRSLSYFYRMDLSRVMISELLMVKGMRRSFPRRIQNPATGAGPILGAAARSRISAVVSF